MAECFGAVFAEFGAAAPSSLREIYTSFVEDPHMLQMLLEEKPAVVSFHFGLPPQPAIDALKNAGIILLCSVTNLAEAQLAEHAGVHALVAQGYEAGGIAGYSTRSRTPRWARLRWCGC